MIARQESSWFPVRRRPGRIGAVEITRLLVFQCVLVLVLLAATRELWLTIVGAVLGGLVLVGVFGRTGRRWWTELLMSWLRYRARRGRAHGAGGSDGDARLAALRELVPDLVVETAEGGAAAGSVGMAGDGAGWYSVLAVRGAGTAHSSPPVPLSELARMASEAEQPGVVIQVVSARTARRHQDVWVAVRLDAQAVAESVVDASDGGSDVDVPQVLAEMTRRAGRLLSRSGLEARPLDADGLIDALARSCDLLGAELSSTAHERWEGWHSTQWTHTCFWLRSWPDPDRGGWLLAALAEVPAALVSIAVVLEPAREDVDLCCLVRLADRGESHRSACAAVSSLAERAGAELYRLDGEHAPAVYASAPSGGGAR